MDNMMKTVKKAPMVAKTVYEKAPMVAKSVYEKRNMFAVALIYVISIGLYVSGFVYAVMSSTKDVGIRSSNLYTERPVWVEFKNYTTRADLMWQGRCYATPVTPVSYVYGFGRHPSIYPSSGSCACLDMLGFYADSMILNETMRKRVANIATLDCQMNFTRPTVRETTSMVRSIPLEMVMLNSYAIVLYGIHATQDRELVSGRLRMALYLMSLLFMVLSVVVLGAKGLIFTMEAAYIFFPMLPLSIAICSHAFCLYMHHPGPKALESDFWLGKMLLRLCPWTLAKWVVVACGLSCYLTVGLEEMDSRNLHHAMYVHLGSIALAMCGYSVDMVDSKLKYCNALLAFVLMFAVPLPEVLILLMVFPTCLVLSKVKNGEYVMALFMVTECAARIAYVTRVYMD